MFSRYGQMVAENVDIKGYTLLGQFIFKKSIATFEVYVHQINTQYALPPQVRISHTICIFIVSVTGCLYLHFLFM